MKKLFPKNLILLLVAFLHITCLVAQTKVGMSLGSIEFVMPTASVTLAERILKMSMSNSFIPTSFVKNVGGVAFVQTAEPEFTVNSFNLYCDTIDNRAYAIINDNTYQIPLNAWMLAPIVDYANDNNNAIVTLFGGEKCGIKYHEAFIDKLLGLRLLQADLLLTDYLMLEGYKLPNYQNGDVILADSEKDFSNDSIKSIKAYYAILEYICKDTINNYYSSYLYTDFNEPIFFNVNNNNIVIKGKPYYRFTKYVSGEDIMDIYDTALEYINNYNSQRKMYKNPIAEEAFTSNTKINKILKVKKSNKSIENKTKEVYHILDYKKMPSDCDSLCAFVEKMGYSYTRQGYDNYYIRYNQCKNFVNQAFRDRLMLVTHYAKKNASDSLLVLIDEIRKIITINDRLKLPIREKIPVLAAYTRHFLELYPDKKLESLLKYTSTYDDVLVASIYEKFYNAEKAVELIGITSWLKENNTIAGDLNPIVMDEATDVCQWSAFFRYAKKKNPKNWSSFVKNVKKLKYDAMKIQTPIDFKNKHQ